MLKFRCGSPKNGFLCVCVFMHSKRRWHSGEMATASSEMYAEINVDKREIHIKS